MKSIWKKIGLLSAGLLLVACWSEGANKQTERQDAAVYAEVATENAAAIPESVAEISNIEIPAKIANRSEQIIRHTGYTVSYNADWKIPNWVAYELTQTEVEGTFPRYKTFMPDPEVPSHLSATTYDYTKSGFDRGHMAPAADMKWSEQAMKESFYLSNVCPQNHNLNGGIWKSLEEQVRDLAAQKGAIYVVCGPMVSQNPPTIGENKVAVPEAFFKVLLQKKDDGYEAIAFVFKNVFDKPNEQNRTSSSYAVAKKRALERNESGRRPLSTYALSVEELQTLTGIDFFPTLPDDIEKEVESRVDFSQWTISVAR